MTLTMHDVMKLGKLNECEVIAGHKGMNRVVKHITIIEVPEVAQWLKGNELLLTTLYSVRNDEAGQISLIQKLNASGVSGLAIKPSQLLEIPKSIIDSADELNFPIIKIPIQIKYLDILTPVMNRLVNDKVILQEDVLQATSLLEEVLLNNRGLHIFKESLKVIIKNPISIESELLETQLLEDRDIQALNENQIFELTLIKRPLKLLRIINGKEVFCIVAPVLLEGEYFGNITSWIDDTTDISMDIAILERAVTLLSIEFLKIKARIEVEHQYENDFVKELLYSDNLTKKKILKWGQNFEITYESNGICAILNVKNKETNEIENSHLKSNNIYKYIKDRVPDALIGNTESGMSIIFISENSDEIYNEKLIENLYKEIKKDIDSKYELIMGIGRNGKGIKGIQNSHEQAEKAIILGWNIDRQVKNKIYKYDDLGVFTLLDILKTSSELNDFYDNTIGNLIKEDKNHELIETLKTYFYYDESLKITAEKLFIHVNTLKYRIKKIEKLTKQDLKTSEGKFNLNLILKILKMKKLDGYID